MFDTDRKFWGWGVASFRFPPPALQRVRAFLEARFGAPLPEPWAPPTLESLRMPAPVLAAPGEFAGIASSERYHRAAHTYGKSFRDIVRALDGDFSGAPDFVAYPRDEADVLARTDYGGPFAAVVGRERVLGIQFHPEKSQRVGLQILRNFAAVEAL